MKIYKNKNNFYKFRKHLYDNLNNHFVEPVTPGPS